MINILILQCQFPGAHKYCEIFRKNTFCWISYNKHHNVPLPEAQRNCVGGTSTHTCMHAAELTSWLKMSDVVQYRQLNTWEHSQYLGSRFDRLWF